MIGRDEIECRFVDKNGTDRRKPGKHHLFRNLFLELATLIDDVCDDTREKHIALERLEEASLWTHQAHRRDRVVEGER